MKLFNNTMIIGIDHGYGNIKTANTVTPTGIMTCDTEPTFNTENVLFYDGSYYRIGEGPKAFISDKWQDQRDAGPRRVCYLMNKIKFQFSRGNKSVSDERRGSSVTLAEKMGVNQCVISASNAIMDKLGVKIDDSIIQHIIRFGKADIADEYFAVLKAAIEEYADSIFDMLRRYEYDPKTMRLYITGGGGKLIENFDTYEKSRVNIIGDICAAAKGYEQFAVIKLRKDGRT